MEKNKIRIKCNPYEKSIKYLRWCFDEEQDTYIWKELGSKSRLLTDKKYTNATIQHNAYEIVEEIIGEYNRGKAGLEIIFDGTKEDFEDLKEVTDSFFDETGVTCESGDLYIDSADTVMPEIQGIFENLSALFYEYNSSTEINQILYKFLDATKTEIPICVVGMYSTGKSAFINSLIGAEVLPSAVNPTTARNYKIVETEKNGAVKFLIDNEKILIYYEGYKYKIEGNIDSELKEKIHEELEKNNSYNMTDNMYYSLVIINEYANETNRIAELIEVEVPFYKSVLNSDKYKFIIYDTPGSDSESHEEHLSVLKKALGDQTNGLPILLTSPKDMDRTGADNLLNVVNGIDGNLDLTNAMIIVNQADGVSGNSLDKVKECADTILSQWKSNRLYFMSAIMGLGSKKNDYENEDDWIDPDYLDVFFRNLDCFTKVEGRLYKQLYKHNQIAPNRMENYLGAVENEKRNRELLYINSGLHCVEKEILEFAKKYALYNKCAQAQDYLEQAIFFINKQISSIEQTAEEIRDLIIKEQNSEINSLREKLSDCINEKNKLYADNYPAYMTELVSKLTNDGEDFIDSLVDDTRKSVKETDKKKRVDEFLNISKDKIIKKEKDYKHEILQYSKKYWNDNKEQLQSECCKIVKADENLTSEEQDLLEKFIMNLDIPFNDNPDINVSQDDVSAHLINIFGHEFLRLNMISAKKTKSLYSSTLKKYIRRINNRINDLHTTNFKKWNMDLKNGLICKMSELNPNLIKLSAELNDYQKDIDLYQEQQKYIKDEQYKISRMFEFKKREES